MYRIFFGILGILLGATAGFLVACLGPELLYGLHLFLGIIVGSITGGIVGLIYGNRIGVLIERNFGDRAIHLLFWIVFCALISLLIWLMSELS